MSEIIARAAGHSIRENAGRSKQISSERGKWINTQVSKLSEYLRSVEYHAMPAYLPPHPVQADLHRTTTPASERESPETSQHVFAASWRQLQDWMRIHDEMKVVLMTSLRWQQRQWRKRCPPAAAMASRFWAVIQIQSRSPGCCGSWESIAAAADRHRCSCGCSRRCIGDEQLATHSFRRQAIDSPRLFRPTLTASGYELSFGETIDRLPLSSNIRYSNGLHSRLILLFGRPYVVDGKTHEVSTLEKNTCFYHCYIIIITV